MIRRSPFAHASPASCLLVLWSALEALTTRAYLCPVHESLVLHVVIFEPGLIHTSRSACAASTTAGWGSLLTRCAARLQMAAYAVGKQPPPTLHWQHRRSESVKLIALMAGLLLAGGLVVASVRGSGHAGTEPGGP